MRAQGVIDAQLAALSDASAVSTTFDSGAVVLGRYPFKAGEAFGTHFLNPHDRARSARLRTLVAGGNDAAVWLMAEFVIRIDSFEPQYEPTTSIEVIRATELITASAGWAVVAAAFSDPRAVRRAAAAVPMVNGTTTGPLAELLTSPRNLMRALAEDPAVVIVPPDDDVAIGQEAARAVLAAGFGQWTPGPLYPPLDISAGVVPKLDGAARELHTGSWGFAQASLSWDASGGAPYRAVAQLLALPRADGAWAVVAVQINAQ